MPVKKKGLGKGLDSLIPKPKLEEKEIDPSVLPMNMVEPNPLQPRKHFETEALEELANSIKEHGVITPIIVQKRKDYYEIVAGERRWRAAKKVGLKEIPAIIRDYSSKELMEIALIENLQREDLNPIEEASAYQELMNQFELTQEELGKRVSKSRSQIGNALRLLKLEPKIQEFLVNKDLSYGHGRALLGLENEALRLELANRIMKEGLSVREVEKIIQTLNEPKKEKVSKLSLSDEYKIACETMSKKMSEILKTKVSLKPKNQQKGKLEIEYYSKEALDRLIQMIEGMER